MYFIFLIITYLKKWQNVTEGYSQIPVIVAARNTDAWVHMDLLIWTMQTEHCHSMWFAFPHVISYSV